MTTTKPGIIATAKDKSVRAIKGTGSVVETTVDTAGKIVTTTVKGTAKVGGTVTTAATGLATGVIGGVEKVGVKTGQATSAVAGGAFKAVGKVGAAAVDAVRTTVTKPSNRRQSGKNQPTTAASRN